MTIIPLKKSRVFRVFTPLLLFLTINLAFVTAVTAKACQGEKAAENPSSQEAGSKIKLPENQEGPIFSFDQANGFRRAPKQAVDFQLFSSGAIKAMNGQNMVELKLSADDLREFLDFVVNKNRIYDLTSDGIKKAMKQKGELPENQIADASTAKFVIDLPKGKHSVDVYALFFAKTRCADVPGIAELVAIESRCRKIVAKHVIADKGDQVVKFVNAEIKRKGIGIDPVNIEELRSASVQSNGRLQATFERAQPNPENTRSPTISINYFFEGKEGKSPVVRVYGLQRE